MAENLRKQIGNWLIRKPSVHKLMETPVGFVSFREKSAPSVYFGFFLIVFSFVIGWPAVGAMGVLSFHTENPWFLTVGGPALYGLSHVAFNVGIWLAGRRYVTACLKWLVKAMIEKLLQVKEVGTSPKA